MGIKNMLQTQGSPFAAEKNGGAILPNPLEFSNSTNTTYNLIHSSLHFDQATDTPSYSVDGSNKAAVNADFIKYKDGVANQLPTPTALDFEDSVTADPNNKPKYTTKTGGTYLENLPN
jgi:hypothetical protein